MKFSFKVLIKFLINGICIFELIIKLRAELTSKQLNFRKTCQCFVIHIIYYKNCLVTILRTPKRGIIKSIKFDLNLAKTFPISIQRQIF